MHRQICNRRIRGAATTHDSQDIQSYDWRHGSTLIMGAICALNAKLLEDTRNTGARVRYPYSPALWNDVASSFVVFFRLTRRQDGFSGWRSLKYASFILYPTCNLPEDMAGIIRDSVAARFPCVVIGYAISDSSASFQVPELYIHPFLTFPQDIPPVGLFGIFMEIMEGRARR